jgi:hypothetical protein
MVSIKSSVMSFLTISFCSTAIPHQSQYDALDCIPTKSNDEEDDENDDSFGDSLLVWAVKKHLLKFVTF